MTTESCFTVHAERGVDAALGAYVVDEDGCVGIPVDRVKPKSSSRLQRERNLEADPRAALLVEHWATALPRHKQRSLPRRLRRGSLPQV